MTSIWRLYAEHVAEVKHQLQQIALDIEVVEYQPNAEVIDKLRRDFYEAKAVLWAVSDDLHEIARHHESMMEQHHFSDDFVLPDAEGGIVE